MPSSEPLVVSSGWLRDEPEEAREDGLSRFVRRFERAGQKSAAKKIASLHTKATALLAERDKAEAEAMATRPDPLAVAFDDAARELRKVLPTCFPSDADALAFARRLPMRDALKVANDLLNERRARLKEVKRIECRFWEAATDAGRLAFGDADDDANLRKLAAAGLSNGNTHFNT